MARFLGLVALLTWLSQAEAASTQNLTALQTEFAPSWVSDPDSRGTWSLLYSCVFTLTLCVYTASHPNVPTRGLPRYFMYRTRTLFVLAALLAPEFGVYNAFTQYQRARTIAKELSKLKVQKAMKQSGVSDSPTFDGVVRLPRQHIVLALHDYSQAFSLGSVRPQSPASSTVLACIRLLRPHGGLRCRREPYA